LLRMFTVPRAALADPGAGGTASAKTAFRNVYGVIHRSP